MDPTPLPPAHTDRDNRADADVEPRSEVDATRAGRVRVALGNALSAAGLATFVLPFPIAWISHAIAPGNPLREAVRGGFGLFLVMGLAPLLALIGSWLRRRAPSGAARVTILGDALVIDAGSGGRTKVPLADLADGVVVPLPEGARLELRRNNGDLLVAEVTRENAERLETLLATTGLGPERRRLRTRAGGWRSPMPFAFVYMALLMFSVIPALRVALPGFGAHWGAWLDMAFRIGVLGGLGGLSWLLASLTVGPEVVVGTDGVSVRGPFRRRYVPHDQIARTIVDGGTVELELKSGERIGLGSARDAAHASALVTRIERARDVTSSSPESSARAESLDRGHRTIAEWRAAIEGLVRSQRDAGAYRGARIERAELLRVVADPDVPADRRVGAALALDVATDRDAATRVRVAAESCADDNVRVALARIADGERDDDAIEAATARAMEKRNA